MKARYRGIPCTYNDETYELVAKPWYNNLILDFLFWFDTNVLELSAEEIPINFEENDDN